jgi:hypothetical protein
VQGSPALEELVVEAAGSMVELHVQAAQLRVSAPLPASRRRQQQQQLRLRLRLLRTA